MITTSQWMGKSMTRDKTYQIIIPTDYKAQCHAKMDTRADMVCAGASFVLLENTGKVCNINGFHNHMGMVKGIPIATCAMAYHHLNLQETVIMVFHECLYFGAEMEHSLICPNQQR